MKIRKIITSAVLKALIRIFCSIDAEAIKEIPMDGPMIIYFNHINFLDAPLFQVFLQPRMVIGFAKKETWDTPVFRFIANTYDTISVDREATDLKAFREVARIMKESNFICMAPEGSRSSTGILQEGKAGIVTMALTTGAPLLPLVHSGTEDLWKNAKRFKRTKIKFEAGKPFTITPIKRTNSDIRKKIIDEMMFQMSILLPEDMRGAYSDLSLMSSEYLDLSEAQSSEISKDTN